MCHVTAFLVCVFAATLAVAKHHHHHRPAGKTWTCTEHVAGGEYIDEGLKPYTTCQTGSTLCDQQFSGMSGLALCNAHDERELKTDCKHSSQIRMKACLASVLLAIFCTMAVAPQGPDCYRGTSQTCGEYGDCVWVIDHAGFGSCVPR
ncbi:hypothetical protein E5Q_04335 [Mixia osmundae IAM 14324]|uniref:CBM1 domain-containing protein n=2 Tax=Mixia osmundae (strain CBS 9802 / IAM 14324 / JCM 22182 / KY 12970) TaxID=764103 RepID=G7E497_MIXOS|nr:hypothetical protein E5Q_04335 [Mixia osmundae IAM 14324]